jgi:hypothetical protein
MPEMTKEDVKAFITKWGNDHAAWMIEADPYYSRHPGHRKREVRGRFEIVDQACSSPSRALASFRSSVSKPSVNQP